MTVPDDIRKQLRSLLWQIADQIGWMNLAGVAKAKHYEQWTRDPTIGGILGRYVDNGQIRVYIKDTLLKGYVPKRLSDPVRIFTLLALTPSIEVVETYTKPHGKRVKDGRVIGWGRADDWKSVLLATHERAFLANEAKAYAAVLLQATGRFSEDLVREMVEDAGCRLGIRKVVWVET